MKKIFYYICEKTVRFFVMFSCSIHAAQDAGEDKGLYDKHVTHYVGHEEYKDVSQQMTHFVENALCSGKSFREILDALGQRRAECSKHDFGFGCPRETMLLTAGNNYFVMREAVEDLLNSMFDTAAFSFNQRNLNPTQAQIDGITNFSFWEENALLHIYRVESKKREIGSLNIHAKNELERALGVWECATTRFILDVPLLTKEEFRTGGIESHKRYEEAFQSFNYYSFARYKAMTELGEKVPIAQNTARYFTHLEVLEQINPGKVIGLTRTFFGFDAQRILVLKHPKARSWRECSFMLIHCDAERISFFDHLLEAILEAIKKEKKPSLLQMQIYLFEYALSAQTPFFRGSSAVKEWFVSGIYKFKGYVHPPRGYCETDQWAQILSFYNFVMKMWHKDGPLQREAA